MATDESMTSKAAESARHAAVWVLGGLLVTSAVGFVLLYAQDAGESLKRKAALDQLRR